jgi:hypothetical protein
VQGENVAVGEGVGSHGGTGEGRGPLQHSEKMKPEVVHCHSFCEALTTLASWPAMGCQQIIR